MAELDKDLLSIQEARTLAVQARDAQRKFLSASQAEVNRICAAMAQAAAILRTRDAGRGARGSQPYTLEAIGFWQFPSPRPSPSPSPEPPAPSPELPLTSPGTPPP